MFVKSGRIAHVNAATKRLYAGIVAFMLLCALALAGCGSGAPSSSASAEAIETTVTITDADSQTASYTAQIPAADATVLAAIEATDAEVTTENGQYGTYITAINGKVAEGNSGWIYTVNDEEVMESVDVCQVEDGDTVAFSYITM